MIGLVWARPKTSPIPPDTSQTLRLITNGDLAASMLNAAGQLSVGLFAVYLGFAAVRLISGV